MARKRDEVITKEHLILPTTSLPSSIKFVALTTSVHGLKHLALKVAGAKAMATDHRNKERKSCRFKNIRIRVPMDGSLVTYSTFKFLLMFNGLLLLKMYVGTYETSS